MKSLEEKEKAMARLTDSQVVRAIIQVLYYGDEGFDQDKEWDSETIELVAEVIQNSEQWKKLNLG